MRGITLVATMLCGLLALSLSAQAASFDCGKAQSKAEHLICDNPELSELDGKFGNIYQDVMSKASEEEKQRVQTEQKHWLKFSRNICRDETCFKHAYWSRQAELETFFAPHSPLHQNESDKAEAIQQVLATAPLYYSAGTDSVQNQFCNQLFDDLKLMKEIRFVDPIVQAQSYEDPALDSWKKQCKRPLHFSYECDPKLYPGDIEKIGAMCGAGYGLPPFKLFELPPLQSAGKNRYVFYSDAGYGPVNEGWQKPIMGGGGSFQKIEFPSCKLLPTYASFGRGVIGEPNYNSIIEYKNQYYYLTLNHDDSSLSSY